MRFRLTLVIIGSLTMFVTACGGPQLSEEILGDWQLVTASSPSETINVEPGYVTVTFGDDGMMTGVQSCAPFRNTYEIDDDRIVVTNIETHAAGCNDWLDTVNFVRTGDRLTATLHDGVLTITNRAQWRFEMERIS